MKPTLALISVLMIASSLVASCPRAQELPGVAPGDRIRVAFFPGAKPQPSVLFTKSTPESLSVLDAGDAPQTLAWSKIYGVERYEGRRGHAGAGALVGATLGVIAGVAAVSAAPQESQWFELDKGSVAVVAAVATVVATGVGALIGTAVRSDRWRKVKLAGTGVRPEGS